MQGIRALKVLSRAYDIIILPTNKGNATMVLNIGDYHQMIQKMLYPSVYKKITRDPTMSIMVKLALCLEVSPEE